MEQGSAKAARGNSTRGLFSTSFSCPLSKLGTLPIMDDLMHNSTGALQKNDDDDLYPTVKGIRTTIVYVAATPANAPAERGLPSPW